MKNDEARLSTKLKPFGKKHVRWGLIGVGDIVHKRVAQALREADGSELAAVAAAHPERAEAFAREAGVPAWHAEWRDLIHDPGVDAIYIATPVACHAAQTIEAARAGKPVLCEKPLGLNAAEAMTMVAACREAGVMLGTAYYRRYYPVIARIREMLAAGEIGAPLIAQMNAFSPFAPAADHPRRWLLDRETAGGGPLKDFGCHRIELLLHLFGPVTNVFGNAGNLRWERPVEDTAVAGLRFAGRVLGTVTVSHAAAESADTLDIYGAAGSLHVPELNGGRLIVATGDGRREESHPSPVNFHLPLVTEFTRSLLSGTPFAVTGEIGAEVDRIIDTVYSQAPAIDI